MRETRRQQKKDEQQERLTQLNMKLEAVRRKQEIRRVLEEDLIKKGATAQMAQSFVMNLDNKDLTRVRDT